MSTKTKTKTHDDAEDERKKLVSWRIDPSLAERIKVLREMLPKTQAGMTASEGSIVEAILLGKTTLAALEKQVERYARGQQ